MSLSHILNRRDERASGRTTMLALHYVQLVLDNPGKAVEIEDHHSHREADLYLFDLVCHVLHVLGVKYDCSPSKMQITSALPRYRITEYPSVDECMVANSEVLWEQKRRMNRPKPY